MGTQMLRPLMLALLVTGGGASPASAQALRPTGELTRAAINAVPSTRTADFIVTLVNGEPITNHEVRQRLLRIEQQMARQGASLPARDQLQGDVLELLIAERAQIQHATDTGLRVDETSLIQAEQALAAQNQLSVDEFRQRLAAEGVDRNQMRNELRNQILLQRVREREVQARVQVNENDIDEFLLEQQIAVNDPTRFALDLSHVLVLVPEGAGDAQVRDLQAKAQQVADRARAGNDFAALARDFSDAAERVNGGAFGMRRADRLPELFVNATRTLPVGGIAGPLRSPAGFHVLRVNAKEQAGQPWSSVVQTRARHILLRPSAQLSQAQATAQLATWREQIVSGKASFEALAREHSQDGSARDGGNLGWASPGQFVPEFESTMDRLAPGQVSAPLVSRFGVHLIRVDERREQTLTVSEQREVVRGLVRERKSEEALRIWMQDLRERAFVEQREAPRI